ncbi:MAG: hypothetical protein AB7G65_20320, partial [Thermoleophilia bacterium]
RSPALDDALQRWVPLPVDHLHAAYALVEPRATGEPALVVACAVERSALEGLPDGTLAASPAGLPTALAARLGGRAPAAASLNLLVGDLQPRALRNARVRTLAVAAAGVVLVLGLLLLGLARRAAHDQARADALLAAASAVELRAAPRPGSGPPDAHRAHRLLAAEIARLRAASAGPADQGLDAAAALADLLSRWPREGDGRAPTGLYARLHSVQVISTGISLTIVLPADADPEPILAGLRSLPGWQLQPTQRSSAPPSPAGKAEARLVLRLVPVRAGATPRTS